MNVLGGQVHRSFGGWLKASLERENKREKSLFQKVYSSGMHDDYSRKKSLQGDNSVPKPFSAEVRKQKSKVVQKVRKAINEKRDLQKDCSLEEVNLLEEFVFTCKNFINSSSRLLKSYSEMLSDKDPLVKLVMSNKSSLSRLVNDIEKHNLVRMEQENEQLKKMIEKLKRVTVPNRGRENQNNPNSALHSQSLELIRKVMKQRFQLKDYLDFERLIETSERHIKIKSILTQKHLCPKSQEKFIQMLQNVGKQREKISLSLSKPSQVLQQRVQDKSDTHDRSITKKLREILKELKVQINVTTNIGLLELLEIKILNMRTELIPNLVQCNYSYTLEIKTLQEELEYKTVELQSKDKLIHGLQKTINRTQDQISLMRTNQNIALQKLKQPSFSTQKFQEMQLSKLSLEGVIRKQTQQLTRMCQIHYTTNDQQTQSSHFEQLVESVQVALTSSKTKITELQKENALLTRKIQDLEEEFENVISNKLRCEEEIQQLRNINFENAYKYRLESDKKRSSSEKHFQSVSRLRQASSIVINDYEGHILRLGQRIKLLEACQEDWEQKLKMRDVINKEMIQQNASISKQLQRQEAQIQLLRSKEERQNEIELQWGSRWSCLSGQHQLLGEEYSRLTGQFQTLEQAQKQEINIKITQIQTLKSTTASQMTTIKDLKQTMGVCLGNMAQEIGCLKQDLVFIMQSIQECRISLAEGDTRQLLLCINSTCKFFMQKIYSAVGQHIQQKQICILSLLQQQQQRLSGIDLSRVGRYKQISTNQTLETQTCYVTSSDAQTSVQLQLCEASTQTWDGIHQDQETNTEPLCPSREYIAEKRNQLVKSTRQEISKLLQHYCQEYQSSSKIIMERVSSQSKELGQLIGMIDCKYKLPEKATLQSVTEFLSQSDLKQANHAYFQTLQKMVQQLLYNKVHLNLQQQIKALPQSQKDKINNHKKKIVQMQNKMTLKDELTQRVLELNKTIDVLRAQSKTLEKKLKYYQEDVDEKENIIQELRSSNKQILNCVDFKQQQTLSLIDQENSLGELTDVVLSDLLDQSGICNDQLEFTKCELNKALVELYGVKTKYRSLDKNTRQLINYLKLSLINMIEVVQNSKDDSSTIRQLLNELKVCKSNIK